MVLSTRKPLGLWHSRQYDMHTERWNSVTVGEFHFIPLLKQDFVTEITKFCYGMLTEFHYITEFSYIN